jgi:hypothetical protein
MPVRTLHTKNVLPTGAQRTAQRHPAGDPTRSAKRREAHVYAEARELGITLHEFGADNVL